MAQSPGYNSPTMPETILALNPDPSKSPARIEKAKYEAIRAAVLAALKERGEIAFKDLRNAVAEHLSEPFDGSVSWYTTTVKLDLEARGLIERIPDRTPQHLRLITR